MYGYSDLYNPMMNPYLPNTAGQNLYQQPQRQEVLKVNGRNGALALTMGPNSSAWALDVSGLVSWLIITDSAGYKTVTPYDVSPHQDGPTPDYTTLDERVKKLEDFINGFTSDTTTAGNEQPANARS